MLKARHAGAIVALSLMMTSVLGAQERRQGGPPPYDPTNEVTVSGTITGTETIEVGGDAKTAVLLMTVDGAPMGIILGPEVWLQKQGVAFKAGATAQVVGLKGFRFNGNPAMMPRSVKVGDKTLTLRDATGKPVWE